MDLKSLQNLSTNDKLLILRTTGGLTMLHNALESGNSLRQTANMMRLEPKTMYRWKNQYPEIATETAPYTRARATQVEPAVDLTRDAAYRIIYAYEEHGTHFKGSIYAEYATPQELWDSSFVEEYFNSFNNSDAMKYRERYLEAIKNGKFKLSNCYLLTYCTVSKKGLIKPQKSIK